VEIGMDRRGGDVDDRSVEQVHAFGGEHERQDLPLHRVAEAGWGGHHDPFLRLGRKPFGNIICARCSPTAFFNSSVGASSRKPPPGVPKPTDAAGVASAGLPPAPRRVTRRSKPSGRRTGLSVDAIVAAAITVLDESGVAGLSMRRVAEQLDTGAASLYAYVS